MKKYTLAVAMTKDNIALIRKTKPEWQAGSYNFVGGKIELNESPEECVRREFWEETGIDIEHGWKYLGKMERPDDFVCYIYTITDPRVENVTTTTDETVVLMDRTHFINSNEPMISNLKSIYQFAISNDFANKDATLLIQYPTK